MSGEPRREVVTAFGGTGRPRRLAGGQGTTWTAGDVVLKPSAWEVESRWRAEVLASIRGTDGFDVARPVRAADGDWVVGGWEAWHVVAGEPDTARPDDAVRAGIAFHEAISHVPRPAFLDQRDDPWSAGDRAAWGEAALPDERLVSELAEARKPVAQRSQLVHGDLLGNVLFATDRPPTIIDWPAYWRPPSWAAAVAVVDALCWYRGDPNLVERWGHLEDWDQALVRALLYRLVTDYAVSGGRQGWGPHAAYERVAEMIIRRARS